MAVNGLDLVGRVTINTLGATNAIKRLGTAFKELDAASKVGLGMSEKTARAFAEAATAASQERAQVAALTKAQLGLNKANAEAALIQERANKTKRESLASAYTTRQRGKAVASGAADATLVAEGKSALLNQRALTEEVRRRIALEEAGSRINSRNIRDQIAQQRLLMSQESAARAAAERGRLSTAAAANALNSAGSSVARFAGGLGVAVGVIEAVGIAAEHSFAQVLRTTGALESANPAKEVATLRAQFDGLANALPISYTELTKIGAAAGQLGIASKDVGSFTATVAKFSATSNVTTEQAATAFGRLDSILPDVQHNYESLADSILNVGVKSVATETQIIAIATQLSSVGGQAGLTSKEIVGLSGALASVGAAPELSRGTFTRLFTEIETAVTQGGDSLQKFADISGVTVDEFKKSWNPENGQAGAAFLRFMDGLRKSGNRGNQELVALGINSVRDRPLLLRLAGAMAEADGAAGGASKRVALLNKLFAEADQSNALGTLNKQYAILSNTTASRLQILLNNIQTTLRVISQSNFGPLNGAIDGLISGFQRFNATLNENVKLFGLIELPIKNSEIVGFGVLLGGVVAVLGLLAAGVLRASAGIVNLKRLVTDGRAQMLAWRASIQETTAALAQQSVAAKLNAANGTFVASTTGVIGRAAGGAAGKMGVLKSALSGVGTTLASVGKGMLALAAITAVLELPQFLDNLGKSSDNLDTLAAKFEYAADSGERFSKAVLSVQRSNVGGLVPNPGTVFKNIDELKKALDQGPAQTGLAKFFSTLGAGAGTGQGAGNPAIVRQIQDMSTEFGALNESLNKVGQNKGFETVAQGLGGFRKEAQLTDKQLLNLINSIPDVKSGLQNMLAGSGKGTDDKSILNYIKSLDQLSPAARNAAKAQEDLKASLEGTNVSADQFTNAITQAYGSAIDFNTIYQKTLDSVNEKARQKWVAAGNDVSTFTDTAKANFEDFAKTAEQAIKEAQQNQANIATIAQAFGAGGAQYVPQLEQLSPQIIQQVVDGMSKGGTAGVDRLRRIFDQANLGPEIANQIATAIDDPKIAYAYTAFGGKTGKQFSDALATSLGQGTGVTGAIDAQFEKTYQKWQSQPPVEIPAELAEAPLRASFADERTYLEAQVLYAQVHGNTDEAKAKYIELQNYIKDHPATTTIDADSAPIRRKGEDAYTYLSELIPVMQIQGYDIPARKKGEDAEAYINRLIGIMTVDGNNKPAKGKADDATRYANGKRGVIQIDAATAAFDRAIAAATRTRTATIAVQYQQTGSVPKSGGVQPGFARGGLVRGPGSSTSDSINARLSDGEFVVNAAATRRNLRLLADLNGGLGKGGSRYASGGYVRSSAGYEGTYSSRESVRAGRGPAINVTELSAYDRKLLRDIADSVGISVTTETISRATARGNVREANRGNG